MSSLRPSLRVLLTASLAVACLVAGYAFGLHDSAGITQLRPSLSAPDQRAFGVVWETLAELERDYYQQQKLDPDKLAAAAAKGMVDSLGDPYTSLSSAEQSDLLTAQLRGSFEGIGVELDRRDGQLTVIAPLAGSPAERAGIRAHDVVAAVDGTPVSGLNMDAVSARIRGQRGTSVTLGLLRDGTPLDVVVVRETIRIESVRSRLLPGEPLLAYVRISTFSEPTAQQLRDQLNALIGQGARGVVLDLRGNPGGYLTSAVDVASTFFKDGVVLYAERADGSRKVYRTAGPVLAPDLPVAVLVDGGSASAAEIVAGALRDNQRGVLVGQKTFGKGTVQELHTLSNDARLRITVAQWLTPNGHALQGIGLEPDVAAAPDSALDEAARLVGAEVNGRG
jgi:carboxyl-terminal processing protease